jgi:iron(III) transport system ATP-binding protein
MSVMPKTVDTSVSKAGFAMSRDHLQRPGVPGKSAGPAPMKGLATRVKVEGLVKGYGAVRAINGVDFDVEPGSTVTLLGPSGCGKTTTLRCIAGLETPNDGRISIGDDVVFDGATGRSVPPERRRLGMVFQSYAIWPHMTVGANVGFPLKIAGVPGATVREKTAAILELVGLAELQDRSAAALSGGQQQRVALARALVHQPRVVLFDEPLSNLDANLRERMRSELQQLQARLGFTAIYVTHDQAEALALSDRVIIMNRGTIEQQGEPAAVFQEPQTEFTARFLGYSNVLRGVVQAVDGTGVRVLVGDAALVHARWRETEVPRIGENVVVAFRGDRMQINAAPIDATENTYAVEVGSAAFLGTHVEYTMLDGANQFRVDGSVNRALTRGTSCVVHVGRDDCHAFRGAAAAS